jgi:hypothetical protein
MREASVSDTSVSEGRRLKRQLSDTTATIKPFAVPLRGEGRRLLGNKAVSEIYEAAGRGELELVKDGGRTLITLRSIEQYCSKWTPAQIKKYPK